jgi:hypothetical protein
MTQISTGQVTGISASGQFRLASANPGHVLSAYLRCLFVPGAAVVSPTAPRRRAGSCRVAAVPTKSAYLIVRDAGPPCFTGTGAAGRSGHHGQPIITRYTSAGLPDRLAGPLSERGAAR